MRKRIVSPTSIYLPPDLKTRVRRAYPRKSLSAIIRQALDFALEQKMSSRVVYVGSKEK